VKAPIPDQWRVTRSAPRPGQQILDLPLQHVIGRRVHGQNPRFPPWRKLVILRRLSSFVGDCPKRMIVDRRIGNMNVLRRRWTRPWPLPVT
jgi:hypothetical protein